MEGGIACRRSANASRRSSPSSSVSSLLMNGPLYSEWKWGGPCCRKYIRMTMPWNRQTSGTRNRPAKSRKHLPLRLARQLHVERVGAKFNLRRPGDCAVRRLMDPAEVILLIPGSKDALSGEVGEIDLSGTSIGKPDPDPVPVAGSDLKNAGHRPPQRCSIAAHSKRPTRRKTSAFDE